MNHLLKNNSYLRARAVSNLPRSCVSYLLRKGCNGVNRLIRL